MLELLNGTHTLAEMCQAHGIKVSLLLAWRKRLMEQAPKVFERESDQDPAQARIAELERLVGRLTFELDVTKKPPVSGGLLSSKAGGGNAVGPRVPVGFGSASGRVFPQYALRPGPTSTHSSRAPAGLAGSGG